MIKFRAGGGIHTGDIVETLFEGMAFIVESEKTIYGWPTGFNGKGHLKGQFSTLVFKHNLVESFWKETWKAIKRLFTEVNYMSPASRKQKETRR